MCTRYYPIPLSSVDTFPQPWATIRPLPPPHWPPAARLVCLGGTTTRGPHDDDDADSSSSTRRRLGRVDVPSAIVS
jgi:hypothetical protein